MTAVIVEIRCPHCRRPHQVTLELERLQRVRPRAHCARCGQDFDVATSLRDRDRSAHRPAEDTPAAPAAVSASDQDSRPTLEPPEPFEVEELTAEEGDASGAAGQPPRPPPTPVRRITRETPAPPRRAATPLPVASAPPEPPARPAPPPPPPTWLEMADPGLSGLVNAPSPGAIALESLLSEGTRRRG